MYLEVFALDDQLAVLGPLDGGLRLAVDVALELGVLLLVGDDALRPLDVARRHLDVQRCRYVGRVFRVLGAALVDAVVLLRHIADQQTARTHPPEATV